MRYSRPRRGPFFQWRHANGFEWNTAELEIHDLPAQFEGFRIVHLSDLHFRAYWSPANDRLLERLRADPPDLLLCTGDYVEDKYDPSAAVPFLCRLLEGLAARHGIFGVRGNHDVNLFGPEIEQSRLKLIENQVISISSAGASMEIVGLPGMHRDHFSDAFVASIPHKKPGVPRIVLGHYPDQILRIGSLQADVHLTGHTHGGQVCLPGGKILVRHDSLPARYGKGIHRMNKTWLIVSRGMGFSGVPVRMFCASEVIEIKLTRDLNTGR